MIGFPSLLGNCARLLWCFPLAAMAVSIADTTPASSRLEAAPPGRAGSGSLVHLCTLEAAPGNAFTTVGVDPGFKAGFRSMGPSVFNVTYVGFESFPQAREAFEVAVSLWSSLVVTPVPINVQATFTPLGSNTLGRAGAESLWRDFPRAPYSTTWYPDALADQLRRQDNGPGSPDIQAEFNSSFSQWYFGLDGNPPPGTYDFLSVVMHELGHGLGFLGSAYVSGDWGAIGQSGRPFVFDRYAVTETGAPLLGLPNPSAALKAQLTHPFHPSNPRGPGVYWAGAHAVSANDGLPPRLYTPATWSSGSSFSHLDESAFPAGHPSSLMTPSLMGAEAIHHPGAVSLGMLADIGWNSRPTSVLRDFNTDMSPDLIFQNTSGQLYAWFMDGVSFGGGSYFSPAQVDPNLHVVGSNDLTGDQQPDLLLQHQQHGAVTLFRMSGTNRTGVQTIPIADHTPWRVVATGDLSNDGHVDIVWQHEATRQIFIWFMQPGNGWAGYAGPGRAFRGDYLRDWHRTVVAAAPNMRLGGLADFDKDGRLDMIWQDDATGALRVWYLNESTVVADDPLTPTAVNPVWRIRSVGDYDKDGHADLIWQHVSSGELYAWFLEGATLTGSRPLTPSTVKPIWRIAGPR